MKSASLKQKKRIKKKILQQKSISNGLNERLNETIINKIRCIINGKKGKETWTTIARECVYKYNKTEHTVTGFSPKYLLNATIITTAPQKN